MKRTLLILMLLSGLIFFAQGEKKADSLEALKFFEGSWAGTGKGAAPGISTIEQENQFILRGKFFQMKQTSKFKPTEKRPQGEVHEDISIFSFDRNRKTIVLRDFTVEGLYIQYALASKSADEKTMTFATESTENLPAGWRAKLTLKISSPNEFTEILEIARAGKDFQVFEENQFKRNK